MLLFATIMMSILALLGSSMMSAVEAKVDLERANAKALRAELMTSSALEYSLRNLAISAMWAGTNGAWITLEGSGRYKVDRIDSGLEKGKARLDIFGEYLEASAQYRADVVIEDHREAWMDKALVMLGADLELVNATIAGGLLFVDDPAGVLDWDPIAQDWVASSLPSGATVTDTNWSMASGGVSTWGSQGGSEYFNSMRQQYTEPVKMPAWNLDSYLLGGTDRMITTDTTIRNLTLDKTLVIVAPPGATIDIKQSTLCGGVVVWHESDYDPRAGSRNTLRVSSSQIGGGVLGIHPDIGIVAPGANLTHYNNSHPVKGLVHLQATGHFDNLTAIGPVFLTDGELTTFGMSTMFNNLSITLPLGFWDGDPLPGLIGVDGDTTSGGSSGGGEGSARVVAFWPVYADWNISS
ncbi:MAG TPA: hypothetical protein VGC54_02390 [Planctomycetota bacterium]